MKLFGESDPAGGDGYVPGAWDEVRTACLDGHISREAYDIIRLHINPPPTPSSAFVRPPGNVHIVPDDFPLESTERPTIVAQVEIEEGS